MSYAEQLGAYVCESRLESIPQEVRHEAKRALLNIVGCALGGADHPATDIALSAVGPFGGPATATVLGRTERTDPLLAALLNGISSHVHDYDDTLPGNFIHASCPVGSAALACASAGAVTGANFLAAFILGFEVTARVGNATYPAHYEAGWHSTGTIGTVGAAVAVGRLLRLSPNEMAHAIGLALTQAAGLREMFGSMAKSFHPGRSAQSGYMAALLAQKGFTAGLNVLEGPRGFAAVQAGTFDLEKLTHRLGETFELSVNTYKPYPSGLVIHPTIDACSQLRAAHHLAADEIARVELRVAPIVKDLCNKKVVATGLEAKFSIYHAAAIGLARGKGGLAEFTDAAANDPQLKRLRDLTEATADPSVKDDAVVVSVHLQDGRQIGMTLDKTLGSLSRPLSDGQLEDKFREQAAALAPGRADAFLHGCWEVEALPDMAGLIDLCVPEVRPQARAS